MAPAAHRDVHLLDRALYAGDPEPTYAWLRETAPCYWDETAHLWALSRHEDVLFSSRHPELFCSGQGYRPNTANDGSMIGQDPPPPHASASPGLAGLHPATGRRVRARDSRGYPQAARHGLREG